VKEHSPLLEVEVPSVVETRETTPLIQFQHTLEVMRFFSL